MLTLQQIFTKVAGHLLTQAAVSADDMTGMCLYRGPRGMRCAVGALVADKHYDARMEGQDACGSVVAEALAESGVDTTDVDVRYLLIALQMIHDNTDIAAWPAELAALADQFGLRMVTA